MKAEDAIKFLHLNQYDNIRNIEIHVISIFVWKWGNESKANVCVERMCSHLNVWFCDYFHDSLYLHIDIPVHNNYTEY